MGGLTGGAGHVPGPEAVVPRAGRQRGGVLAKCWCELAPYGKCLEVLKGVRLLTPRRPVCSQFPGNPGGDRGQQLQPLEWGSVRGGVFCQEPGGHMRNSVPCGR